MNGVYFKQLAGVSITERNETNRVRQPFAFISIQCWIRQEIEPHTGISATKFSLPS